MLRGLIAASLLGGLATACASLDRYDQRSVAAEARAGALAYCKSVGVNPGSDAYALCRRKIDATGSADATVWQKAVPDRRSLERDVKNGDLAKP